MSEYYRVDEVEIIDLLRRQGLVFKIVADEVCTTFYFSIVCFSSPCFS